MYFQMPKQILDFEDSTYVKNKAQEYIVKSIKLINDTFLAFNYTDCLSGSFLNKRLTAQSIKIALAA